MVYFSLNILREHQVGWSSFRLTTGHFSVIENKGWADEIEIHQKEIHALIRMSAGNPGFSCKECGNWFQPKPKQWIFHMLCDECFATYNKQMVNS